MQTTDAAKKKVEAPDHNLNKRTHVLVNLIQSGGRSIGSSINRSVLQAIFPSTVLREERLDSIFAVRETASQSLIPLTLH